MLEERLEFFGAEIWVSGAFEPTATHHQIGQHRESLAAFGAGGEGAAQQIQHPVGSQGFESFGQLLPLAWQLAHALQQLLALADQLGGHFVATLLVQVLGPRQAGLGGHQGEIRLAATAQCRSLGWLKGTVGELEALEGLSRLQQQQ